MAMPVSGNDMAGETPREAEPGQGLKRSVP